MVNQLEPPQLETEYDGNMAQTLSYLPRRLYPSQGFPILLMWYGTRLFLDSCLILEYY